MRLIHAPFLLGQRTLLRDADTAWKPRRGRPNLWNEGEALVQFRSTAAQPLRGERKLGEIDLRADPENRRSTGANEWKTQLGRDRRLREGLGHCDTPTLDRLLLRPAPDDRGVRRSPA